MDCPTHEIKCPTNKNDFTVNDSIKNYPTKKSLPVTVQKEQMISTNQVKATAAGTERHQHHFRAVGVVVELINILHALLGRDVTANDGARNSGTTQMYGYDVQHLCPLRHYHTAKAR